MGMFDNIKDKAEKLAADHPDQVEKISDQAIDHAGDAADKATGGKHVKQVDGFQEKADGAIGSKD
jgi:hypothetical protein